MSPVRCIIGSVDKCYILQDPFHIHIIHPIALHYSIHTDISLTPWLWQLLSWKSSKSTKVLYL